MKRNRAEEELPEKKFYTIRELRYRYGNCAASTIYRKILREGFPRQQKFGRSNLFLMASVHEWERAHMPLMHPPGEGEAEQVLDASDAVAWKKLKQELDKPRPAKRQISRRR